MLKKNLMLVLALTLVGCGSSAFAQRGPSTPEERQRAEKPKAKYPLLEELLQKQQAGALADHVKEGMKRCTKQG